MTDETLEQYIMNYNPKGSGDIQIAQIHGYDFTFLLQDRKAIGVALDMDREPHIYVLEEYRGNGYGSRLLEKYLIENEYVGSNQYVYYNAGTCDGERLISRFKQKHNRFQVINVGERKYIILRDHRF